MLEAVKRVVIFNSRSEYRAYNSFTYKSEKEMYKA